MQKEISTIGYAILGLLSWRALTGYDVKNLFANSAVMHWSGNNNQIYKTLLDLHRNDLVSVQVHTRESGPLRKVYSITDAGRTVLREWVTITPEPPQLRHPLLIQLAWADQLSADALAALLKQYKDDIETQLSMLQNQAKSQTNLAKPIATYLNIAEARTKREAFLWRMIQENWISFYQNELNWLHELSAGLTQFSRQNNRK